MAKVWWLLFRDTVYIHLFITAVDTPSKSDIIRYDIGHNSQHSQLLSTYTRVTCPRVSVHRSVMLYAVSDSYTSFSNIYIFTHTDDTDDQQALQSAYVLYRCVIRAHKTTKIGRLRPLLADHSSNGNCGPIWTYPKIQTDVFKTFLTSYLMHKLTN